MAMEQYSRLRLEFDKVTGAMKFAGQEAVSLQKQVRLLRQELTLGSYTEDQFNKIQNALAETEFKLKQAQLRGKDLFEQIGTLGGPFGELSNRIDRAIKLFNAFNNITFDELKDKFRNLAALISGDVESISEEIESIPGLGGRPAGMRESVGNVGEAGQGLATGASTVSATASTAAAVAATQAFSNMNKVQMNVLVANAEILKSWNRLQAAIKSGAPIADVFAGVENLSDDVQQFKNWALANEQLLPKIVNLQEKYKDWIFTVQEGSILIGINDQALRKLTNAELGLLATTDALAVSTQGYIITQEEATIAEKKNTAAKALNNRLSNIFIGTLEILRKVTLAYSVAVDVGAKILSLGFTPALRAATIAVQALYAAIGAVVGFGLGMLLPAIKEWITGFAQMSAEAENLNTQISNISKVLEMDLKDTKRRGAEKIAEMKKNNATSEEIRQEELKNTRDYYNSVTRALDEARQKEKEAMGDFSSARKIASDRFKRDSEEFKNSPEILKAVRESYQSEMKRIKQAEKDFKGGGFFGLDEKAAEQMAKNVKEAGDLRLRLEQEQLDAASEINVKGNANIEATTKEHLQNRIKAIDAQIENEIYSETTRTQEIEKLYRERNQIVDYLDKDHKLKQSERDERSRQQSLKILNATIDDEVRTSEAKIKQLESEMVGVGQGTQEQFDLRRQIIAENLKKELDDARRDERTREENQRAARTKHYLALREIEKNELEARKDMTQTYRNAETENTNKFFNLERQLLMDEMAIQLKIYENNEQKKLALKEEYAKKLRDVDARQLEYQGDLMQRAADVEWQGMGKQERVGLNWLISKNNKVREINEEQYQYQIAAENYNYEAAKKRAAGNAAELQVIEAEHIKNINQLRANQIETNQQLNQMMVTTAIQFGQTMSQIGDVLLNNAQGRNKKQFESAKKIMKASIIIEKAGAIGQIWSNNAIANAKATAVFWKTFGQPWVTINTISAGLATAATIASAAKAIQEIDGKQFTPEPSSMGKNYEGGGLIGGNRHSQGGTMIEAEQGEAVMTRGAVTMFAPLLSTLNQMGGGTAFSRGAVGQAGFDAPDYKTANNMQSPQIVKTYVVENELTSSQQKQARLKNLSTL